MSLRMLSLALGLAGCVLLRPGQAAEDPTAVPPLLRFTSPSTAEVIWESSQPGTGALAFGVTPRLGTVVAAEADGMVLRAVIEGLQPGQDYHYKVATTIDGKRHLSPAYTFSNALNFSVVPVSAEGVERPIVDQARAMVAAAGVDRGHAVTLGVGDAAFLTALAAESELMVHAVETDPDRVRTLRQELYRRGVYGSRVSVLVQEEGEMVGVTPCFANLVIAGEDAVEDAMQLAVPGRGAVMTWPWKAGSPVRVRPPLEGIGEWTHQYGDAANTASSGESLSGVRSTEDLTVQWVGRPGGDFGIDRNPRMPAPVAANGRLFHQGHNRVAALDAYNGAVLWSLEIPDLRRVNIPRDCGNWCVDADHLYMAVKDRVWIHDAATGRRVATLPVPGGEGTPLYWGYIATVEGRLFGSGVRPSAVYERYWGGEAWYDAKAGGLGTAKVCSDRVFAYELGSRKLAWSYEKGVILNPTLAVGDGRVVFIECRHPGVEAGEARQINDPELWLDQYLVALDAATGEVEWETPIDLEDGLVSFYLQLTPRGVVITASNEAFHLYQFDHENGDLRWSTESAWPDDHHSGHIQHPVVVNDKVYLQPNGFDLATGEVVTSNVGERSGCHTYVGAGECLIYRGENRQIAIWDQQEEKVSSWTRLRPSCWLSVIPSNGMLLVPEGGAGCSCGGWMETSLVFAPKKVLGMQSVKGGTDQ